MQQLLQQVPGNMQAGGVNGILLDLGISSMQVSIIDDVYCAMTITVSACCHTVHQNLASFTMPPETCIQPKHMCFMSNITIMLTPTLLTDRLPTGPHKSAFVFLQVDQAHRGFSFSQDAPLDMRMGPSAEVSAEQVLNTWSEAELGQIFREYGEERHWKGIASRWMHVPCLTFISCISLFFCSWYPRFAVRLANVPANCVYQLVLCFKVAKAAMMVWRARSGWLVPCIAGW